MALLRDYQEPYPTKDGSVTNEDINRMKLLCTPYFSFKSETGFFSMSANVCVYTANHVEKAGVDLVDTTRILNKFVSDPQGFFRSLEAFDSKQQQKRREVVQYFGVLQQMFCSAQSKYALSEDLIKHWHHQLLHEISPEPPGVYRKHGVLSVEKIFPNYDQVPILMANLISQCNNMLEDSRLSPFAKAAWLAHAFVSIHPFDDGNGRLGLLLANYLLWYHGFAFPVPIATDKEQYMAALNCADQTTYPSEPRRTGQLALLILTQAHAIVSNYRSNMHLQQEFGGELLDPVANIR